MQASRSRDSKIFFNESMKTEKGAVGESAAETKQKEKTGCQENDSRTATNTHSKLQTPVTNSKNTRKKDLELNTGINILL